MRSIIQTVEKAEVFVKGKLISRINSGMVAYIGIVSEDNDLDIDKMANKLIKMRLFQNNNKDFETSLIDNDKEILLISQFTLFADLKKGQRPYFAKAAKSEFAKKIFDSLAEKLAKTYKSERIKLGSFGSLMTIKQKNIGPITIIYDTKNENFI